MPVWIEFVIIYICSALICKYNLYLKVSKEDIRKYLSIQNL